MSGASEVGAQNHVVMQIKRQGNVVATKGAPITLIIRVIRVIVIRIINIRVILLLRLLIFVAARAVSVY